MSSHDTHCVQSRIWQVIGYKNAGKTTLITKLVQELRERGYTTAVIKHDGHNHFDIDHPNTDSGKYSEAGAEAVAVISDTRHAVIEKRSASLEDIIKRFSVYDYILVEGFKNAAYPKLLMVREQEDLALLQLEQVRAVIAAESEWLDKEQLPESAACYNRDDVTGIANFMIRCGVQ
ncbi:molybdopterin-guanine dinucleotide biosynthesis protein B [Paenibacillus sp. FSL H7-0326]|uniref:molybdopterin-guanine dinucleotide biosynthesis protein B n=1 Tax=Paenibacillus sp. FSL H7-0326 TaxID=1921144 RepID=UPI00096FC99A|nr:molybdopterin-guanine dinucleotide biosynthesis protein B [Paenibacillus sp. FSL H7-0326]OMC68381.1 molybdopterin-guanine dinucleotide biosynthesis protein B [Paenibacillus sp. FSL H7-0326]